MASVVSGIKDRGRAAAFASYIERKEECICSIGDKDAKEKFNELEKKLLSENPSRVTQRRLIVPVPTEFLNNADKNMKKFAEQFSEKYFSVCATWNMALHAGGKDLKNPHIHIIFSPTDANGKNIRDLSKSNYMFLDAFKKNVGQFLHNELGIEIRQNDKKQARKRYPRWVAEAYKRAEKAELAGDKGALKQEYIKRYPIFEEFIKEKERKKKLQEFNELKNEEKKFSEKFKNFAERTKKVFDKITGSEEAKIKEKVKEIQKGNGREEKQEPIKEEQKENIISKDNELEQKNQDFGRDKNKEMQLDEFSQDLERRLKKTKNLGIGR
jgi:hypothetical protein